MSISTSASLVPPSVIHTVLRPPPKQLSMDAAYLNDDPQTVDDLVRMRAQDAQADAPIVAYPASSGEYIFYSPRELNAYASRAAVHYARLVPQRVRSTDPVQVIGLLGSSTFDYLITVLALTRLGHTVLFLSTRISEDAYVGLVNSTRARMLLVSPFFKSMADKVAQRTICLVDSICGLDDLEAAQEEDFVLQQSCLDPAVESNHVAWIIHSSGSTGLPKPVFQTHTAALNNYTNNFGLRGFITLPFFHAHGISCFFRAVHARKLIYMYSADLPLTAPHLIKVLEAHDIEILYAVPYALKLLAESERGITLLASLRLVMFGGSSCPKPIGDRLTERGVFLVSHYGSTETGQLMTSFRHDTDKDWDYVRPSDNLKPFLKWEEQGPGSGIYELVVLKGWPSKVASNRPDDSYATKDLFERHPSTPDSWRYYARRDDTLVLENGEKANPLVIEGVARENPNVSEAVGFGANKPYIGLFVIRSENASMLSDNDLVSSIWAAVQTANEKVPAFARLSRNMIKVLQSNLDYRRTDKGTIIRAAFYRQYKHLIDSAYQEEVPLGTLALDKTGTVSWLRKQLLSIMNTNDNATISSDTDLFGLGVDSLQSLRLRSVIQAELDIGGQTLPQNFVFENPTFGAMAEAVLRLRKQMPAVIHAGIEERMAALIQKYGNFDQGMHTQRSGGKKCIIVTGATGSLGAHITAQLCADDQVARVYCLVRSSDVDAALQRIQFSLKSRRLLHALSSTQLEKLVPLPVAMSDPRLGLSAQSYASIAEDVTGIIHCAWSVNFNLSLESFENDCIAGTRHLLDLCLASNDGTAADFAFCSSVSTIVNTPGEVAPEDLPQSLTYAQGMGYAQSKLVTEHICRRAAEQTGMQARVLRIGQIIGDTTHGIWNATEAIPLIFQSAITTGALPTLNEMVSWTPVDIVARSTIEALYSKTNFGVINLTNPHLIHWTNDLLPLLAASGLVFEKVGQKEWIARLRASDPDPSRNPPIKLIDFFAKKYDKEESGRRVHCSTSIAVQCSPTLASCTGLSQNLVQRFVTYFQNNCWA